ncbi:MAG: hypothetical protein AAFU57_01050 [Bacteroidota bacterium]
MLNCIQHLFTIGATIKIEPESHLNGQAGKLRLTLIHIHTLHVTRLNGRACSYQKKDIRTKTQDIRFQTLVFDLGLWTLDFGP